MNAISNKPERVHATCPHDCPSTCALEVERLAPDRIGKVYGAKDHPYTRGVICAKVSRYAERIHHPDRLTTPLRRVGEKGVGRDSFAPISWETALDETANNLILSAQKHGLESVWPYHYAGTMGLVQRDGLDRLRNTMGYSRMHATFCTALSDAGWLAGAGVKRGVDTREMEESDLIVIWGGNPVSTQVNVMHYVSQARRLRNAKLVVIDPYRTGTARKADVHLKLKPGTDGALACAVMHVLFAEGLADREYLAQHTDCPDEFEVHLQSRGPKWAAEITGLSAEQIIEFARLYGNSKRSFIRIGYGFTRSRNGAVNMHAVSCLPAVSGAWQHKGGGALYGNSGMYPIDFTMIKGLDSLDHSTRIMDQSRIGPVLCGNPEDLAGGPPVSSIFIQNTNPMVVAPETGTVRKGFARGDLFVCVHEQFMTETAAMADIVLPATMFLEHDDLYVASGHTFVQYSAKVIDAPSEARSNHQVLCELAKRLGAEHRGFELSENELIDETLVASGLPSLKNIADTHWHDCALDFETSHFLNGFANPDGKFRFKPNWSEQGPRSEGLPAMPDHYAVIERTSEQHPFRLVTAPARGFLNTTFNETDGSQKQEGRKPTVMIHPEDMEALGFADSEMVTLGNALGQVSMQAKSSTDVSPGVMVSESLWPNHAFPEGTGINTLVSAQGGYPNGGGAFHDVAIWARQYLVHPTIHNVTFSETESG